MSVIAGFPTDWKYRPTSKPLENAQVIIGMAFGANTKGRNEEPGMSNEAIGRVIQDLWRQKQLPLIAQR
jgi:hypothetical protein